LQGVIAATHRALTDYRFNDAANELYQFFWHEFCDWYLEIAKIRLGSAESQHATTRAVLLNVFETTLRLMHPYIPFLTEELWQQLPQTGETIVKASYPEPVEKWVNPEAEQKMTFLMQVVASIRNVRNAFKIPNSVRITVYIRTSAASIKLLDESRSYITNLALLGDLRLSEDIGRPERSATAVLEGVDIYVLLEGLIDIDVERTRLARELGKVREDITWLEAKLARSDFLEKAPEEVIEKEQAKHRGLKERAGKLELALESIQ
jgi:valyl-tRNA synthetase